MPSKDEFRRELLRQLKVEAARGAPSVLINSGELHRSVGGYPGPNARMPSCCAAMYHEQRLGDEIVNKPPKGKGASLSIRYRLPR